MATQTLGVSRWGVARDIAYGLFTLTGIGYALQPAPSIVAVLGHNGTLVWAIFLALGSGLCTLSTLFGVVMRLIGLPLVITACMVLGVSLLLDSHGGIPRPGGVFFTATALMFCVQLANVWRLMGLATGRRKKRTKQTNW